MKLGDLKISALKLMFANYEDEITGMSIDTLSANENYGSYLVNMNESVNRALDKITASKVLPNKVVRLKESDSTPASTGNVRFDLGSIIEDFYSVGSIFYFGELGAILQPTFVYAARQIFISEDLADGVYVDYFPKVDHISLTAGDNLELDIPDYIASYIPYFIKSDLFEEDEPSAAQEARAIFERHMLQLAAEAKEGARKYSGGSGKVKIIYSMGDLS